MAVVEMFLFYKVAINDFLVLNAFMSYSLLLNLQIGLENLAIADKITLFNTFHSANINISLEIYLWCKTL